MTLLRGLLPLLMLGALDAAEPPAKPAALEILGTPATSLLLDKATAFARTADLLQYQQSPTALSGQLTGRGNGVAAILMQHWATEFATIYPQVSSDLASGGEAAGIPELSAGTAAVAAMRRPLTEAETATLTARFGHPPLQLTVAMNGVAVLVNIHNPIPRLSLAQLDLIFSRTPRAPGPVPETWGDLGVQTTPLDKTLLYRCALNRSLNQQFRNLIFGTEGEFRYDLNCSLVPGLMLQTIASEPGSIGFASIMFATSGTRAVPLSGADGLDHLPTYDEALAGTYPLILPLKLVVNPTMSPLTKEFLRFTISRRGQRIAAQLGAFPLNAAMQVKAQEALHE